MSTEAVKWAMELAPPMPAQLVATLTGLAYHADKHGRGAFPSVPRLAAFTCKADRTVRRDIRDLEELKLIRKGDASLTAHLPADRRPEVYDLAVERFVPGGRAGGDDRTRASARTLASARARGGKKKPSSTHESTPERPDVDVRADASVRADARVRDDRTPTSATTGRGRPPNQLPEPTTETKDSSTDSTSNGSQHLEAFGAFWLTYPKKKSREEAKQAWIAAMERGADPQRIVAAAGTYAQERADEDPKYTKHPATWLNKGCYDDEPDTAGRPSLRALNGGQSRPTHEDINNWTDEEVANALRF